MSPFNQKANEIVFYVNLYKNYRPLYFNVNILEYLLCSMSTSFPLSSVKMCSVPVWFLTMCRNLYPATLRKDRLLQEDVGCI